MDTSFLLLGHVLSVSGTWQWPFAAAGTVNVILAPAVLAEGRSSALSIKMSQIQRGRSGALGVSKWHGPEKSEVSFVCC